MGTERLKANTPKRWVDPRPELTFLKYFFLISLSFFAVFIAAFLIFYLAAPSEAKVFIYRVKEFLNHA